MQLLPPTPLRVGLMALFASLLLGAPALALEEEADDFLELKSIGAVQIQAISSEGAGILKRIAAARAAIQSHNLQKARFEAAKARSELLNVRYRSPATRIEDKIARAIGLARGGKATTRDLQPIFAELDAVKTVDEMVDVREQVKVAKGRIVAGSQEEAVDALVLATSHIHYFEIDLPIQDTLNRVNRAVFQLRHQNPLAAYASLGEAASHVETFVAIASRTEIDAMSDVGAGPR